MSAKFPRGGVGSRTFLARSLLGFASSTFYDEICLTDRHDPFERLNYLKDPFL